MMSRKRKYEESVPAVKSEKVSLSSIEVSAYTNLWLSCIEKQEKPSILENLTQYSNSLTSDTANYCHDVDGGHKH